MYVTETQIRVRYAETDQRVLCTTAIIFIILNHWERIYMAIGIYLRQYGKDGHYYAGMPIWLKEKLQSYFD